MSARIVRPTLAQLQACYDLETRFTPEAPGAEENGFFLPGAPFSLYEDLLESGYVRIIADGAGVASYIAAVPPGHAAVRRLLSDGGSLKMTDAKHRPDPEKSVWIAKIATAPAHRRKGHAAALYQKVFSEFLGMTAYTATALSPLRNKASEIFHESQSMQTCGVFMKGDGVNLVWMKKT